MQNLLNGIPLNGISLDGIHRNGDSPNGVLSMPLPYAALPAPTPLGIADFRERLQPPLDEFIASKTARYIGTTDEPLLRAIWEYPRRLVAARGKRLRPYVAYLMRCALIEGDETEGDEIEGEEPRAEPGVLWALVGLELFHLFCLIHDDIVDQGGERHALPTAQRFVIKKLCEENRLRDHVHIGNAQAMLLGDMFFAWSHEAFCAQGNFDGETLRPALRYFQQMIDEVVMGEMMDVDMTTRRSTSSAAIHQKMLLKTASYTFIRPLQIGAALAGQSKLMESFCHNFGLSLGIAFQVQDDLLDLIGTTGGAQKTALCDLREGQHTYFTQYIFEHGTNAQQNELRELMGAHLSEADRPRVLELFENSGALAHGKNIIRRHLDDACYLLDHAPARLKNRDVFCALIHGLSKQ
jgi:geranylgeranyl diphosphate synthase type I